MNTQVFPSWCRLKIWPDAMVVDVNNVLARWQQCRLTFGLTFANSTTFQTSAVTVFVAYL